MAIEGSAAPIRNKPGRVKGAVVIFRDVTAKILAEEKAQKLTQEVEWAREDLYSFFMQAPIPMVIMMGPDHRFALANEPYERFVGRKVVGKTVAEAFRPEEAAPFIPLLDSVYQTGKPWIGTRTARFKRTLSTLVTILMLRPMARSKESWRSSLM